MLAQDHTALRERTNGAFWLGQKKITPREAEERDAASAIFSEVV